MEYQLINASRANNLELVRELLGKGADPNATVEISNGANNFSIFDMFDMFDAVTTPLVDAFKKVIHRLLRNYLTEVPTQIKWQITQIIRLLYLRV